MSNFQIALETFLLATAFGSGQAARVDPCDSVEATLSDVRLVMQSTSLTKHGSFIGVFEIENTNKKEAFSIGLVRGKSVNFAYGPDTSIEYMDMAGDWKRLLDLPGSFRGVTHMQTLSPGESYKFSAMLLTAKAAALNAREFRFLLRTYNPHRCIFSTPFQGLPSRPPVIKLQSISGLQKP